MRCKGGGGARPVVRGARDIGNTQVLPHMLRGYSNFTPYISCIPYFLNHYPIEVRALLYNFFGTISLSSISMNGIPPRKGFLNVRS